MLIADAGLHVSESRYLFQSLVMPKLAVRLREFLVDADPAVPSVPTPLINHVLQSWCRWEHLALGWLPFGTSVMAVAEPGDRVGTHGRN